MILSATSIDNQEQQISFQELINQSTYTLLYFYPKDDTPGCTLEAQDFKALSEQFNQLGCQIIGVSKDNHKSHCKFKDKYELNFQLISDSEWELHKQFDTVGEKSMYGKKYIGTIRSSFLINKEGSIIQERRNVSVPDHAKKVLEKLKEVVK